MNPACGAFPPTGDRSLLKSGQGRFPTVSGAVIHPESIPISRGHRFFLFSSRFFPDLRDFFTLFDPGTETALIRARFCILQQAVQIRKNEVRLFITSKEES
jgi:hypothetical protein